MHGEDDEQFRHDSGNLMRALYEASFGAICPGMAATTEGAAFCASPHVTMTAFCASPHATNKAAA